MSLFISIQALNLYSLLGVALFAENAQICGLSYLKLGPKAEPERTQSLKLILILAWQYLCVMKQELGVMRNSLFTGGPTWIDPIEQDLRVGRKECNHPAAAITLVWIFHNPEPQRLGSGNIY